MGSISSDGQVKGFRFYISEIHLGKHLSSLSQKNRIYAGPMQGKGSIKNRHITQAHQKYPDEILKKIH